jgi:hypothetical protein
MTDKRKPGGFMQQFYKPAESLGLPGKVLPVSMLPRSDQIKQFTVSKDTRHRAMQHVAEWEYLNQKFG